MNTVTVNKADLIKRLEENREKHRDLYDRAVVGYHDEIIEESEKALKELKAKNISPFEFRVRMVSLTSRSIPEDHTSDYDVVIDMLTCEISDTVEITRSDWRAYARDEWDWAPHTTITNTRYAARAGS